MTGNHSNKLLIIFLIVIVFGHNLYAQSLEVTGGPVFNNLHRQSDASIDPDYSNKTGFSLGIGVDQVKIDWLTLRMTFEYIQYGGHVLEEYNGLAGGGTTTFDFQKSLVTLGLFPFNYRLIDRIDLNLGIAISRLVYDSFTGTNTSWYSTMSGPVYTSYDLDERYNSLGSVWYFGILGRVAWDIPLTRSIILSPQYSFYWGLTDEFDQESYDSKSWRHFTGLGLQMELK